MLGLTAQTPQPMGGEFSIGENGEPDGLLFERASNLLAPLRPEQTPEVMASYLKAAMDYAASLGVTTAQSNDLSENNYSDFLAAIDLLDVYKRQASTRVFPPGAAAALRMTRRASLPPSLDSTNKIFLFQ